MLLSATCIPVCVLSLTLDEVPSEAEPGGDCQPRAHPSHSFTWRHGGDSSGLPKGTQSSLSSQIPPFLLGMLRNHRMTHAGKDL